MSKTVLKKDADRVVAALSAYADSRDARIAELEAAIIALKREHGSPVPDYALRRVLRDKLFSMVNR